MAIAFVQKAGTETTDVTSNATIALTTNATVSAGNLLVGFVSNQLTTNIALSSVAGGGLTWAVPVTQISSGSNIGVGIFYAQAPSGLASGTTITATLANTAARKVMGLYEFSGADTTGSVIGVTAANGSTTGNPAVTLGSAATANDLVFAAFEHNVTTASETITPFGSFQTLGSAVAGTTTSLTEGVAQYVVDATGTTDAAGYTPGTDTTFRWLAVAACFHIFAGTVYTDTGTIAVTTALSGSDDGLASVDAGTIAVTTALAGTDNGLASVDTGTIAVTTAVSGDDLFTPAVGGDTGQTVIQSRHHNVVLAG